MNKSINSIDHVAWISRPENLGAVVARLEMSPWAALVRFDRHNIGPLTDEHPASLCPDKFVLWKRIAGEVMNTSVVLGDIDYSDGVIPFSDAERGA